MVRVLFLLEWTFRFVHLGASLRVQKIIRNRLRRGGGDERKHVFIHMVAYNGTETIEEAVESVISQTYENWTLLISDDASSDGTPDLMEKIAARDSRIMTKRMPVNSRKTRSSHRNVGLSIFREGSWDFYTVLDQDDVAEKDWLENCLSLDWSGLYALRMWNARYDWSLSRFSYSYPTAAQLMIPRRSLIGVAEYQVGLGMPGDSEFLYRLEYRAVKTFKAIAVAPFLCQKMRFSNANMTANAKPETLTRRGHLLKFFLKA